MAMDDLVTRAMDLAAVKGAAYSDVRLVETNQERFVVRTGVVDTLSNDESQGIGVRVLVNGSWGVASTNILSPDEVDGALARARAALAADAPPPWRAAPLKRAKQAAWVAWATRGRRGRAPRRAPTPRWAP